MTPTPLRVAIIGLDHWYCGLDAAEATARHPNAELVVIAHHDAQRAKETTARFRAAEWTTDYQQVIERDDIQVIVTACTVAENAALCIAAARSGKHIASVKPIAMTVADARQIEQAVLEAGTYFLSWDSYFRLSPPFQQIKKWIGEGRIGRPISGQVIRHTGLPNQEWPNTVAPNGRTWWLDPQKTVGGGWIDHSIYSIDAFRWLFDSEIVEATGHIAQQVHPELRGTSLEDYGLATLKFSDGQIAGCEVTWTAAPGAGYFTTQITGTEGAIILQTTPPAEMYVSGNWTQSHGWRTIPIPSGHPDPVSHLIACIQSNERTVANVTDALHNLEACISFYEHARSIK